MMRGTKSINGNNNALYVVDGIPMPSPVRRGNQPDDIFTGMGPVWWWRFHGKLWWYRVFPCWRGAAASALYGMDAANGVIMITTKKGKQESPTWAIPNNTTFYTPFVTPEFQNTYGQTSSTSMYSWGNRLTTPSSYDPFDFFQTDI